VYSTHDNREMLGSEILLQKKPQKTKQNERSITLLFDHRRSMGNCTCKLELPKEICGPCLFYLQKVLKSGLAMSDYKGIL